MLGTKDSVVLGLTLGEFVGTTVGNTVGIIVGTTVGVTIGAPVGQIVGILVGALVGDWDGVKVGTYVGINDGLPVEGTLVGDAVEGMVMTGAVVIKDIGLFEGFAVGLLDGRLEGCLLG